MKRTKFDNWIKANTTRDPSHELDAMILREARRQLTKTPNTWAVRFAASGLVAAAMVVVILALRAQAPERELALSEPIELIRDFDEIELMAETSSWPSLRVCMALILCQFKHAPSSRA